MCRPQNLLAVSVVLTSIVLASLGAVHGQSSTQNANIVRCLERERRALLKFKAELFDEFGRLSSWGDGEENNPDCCKWRGVHCHNKTDHVVRLDLHTPPEAFYYYSETLRGTISTSLLELQHLQYLDLSANQFNTIIPEFIGSLSELRYLNLSHSVYTGAILYHLGNLSKLLTLDLGHNYDLHSKSLGWVSKLQSLEVLDLSRINLSDATNWLEAISKLTNLKELYLDDCKLPNIPPSLLSPINASTSLAILDLGYNSDLISIVALTRWFSNFSSSLAFVDLSGIDMKGPIPDVFQNMVALEHLSLFRTGLQGGIPKYFGNMSSLRHLDLSYNNLTQGPECRLQLPHLEVLALSSNKIKGPIPNLSGCPSLKELRLDNNMFNGTLNGHIGGLFKLEVLLIASNLLEGMITEAHIFNLSQLRDLDLSFNSRLTIKFNPDLSPPFQLESIGLAKCSLGPSFPAWFRNQRKLKYIDIFDAGITDTVKAQYQLLRTKLQRRRNKSYFCTHVF